LQPDGVNILYFKPRLFDSREFIFRQIKAHTMIIILIKKVWLG